MIRRTLLTALVLSIATSAHAKPTVTTAVIPSNIAGANHAVCTILNTGTKTVSVTIEIVDANSGNQLGFAAGLYEPSIQRNASIGGSGSVNKFCRVTGLSKSNVTISFTEFDASNTPLMTVTAP